MRAALLLLSLAGWLISSACHGAWRSETLAWQASPVDLSFLNAPEKPAGKRGFLKARHAKLVFEDGTETRLWGANLSARALFATDRANVTQQARRLSQLGFNLVRIHHHDSPWVSPNIFGAQASRSTRDLDVEMLDRLDWWIHCLKNEGIYVWLDLHVQRHLVAGDGIEGYEEIAKDKASADLKGFNYLNRSIAEAMRRFNEAYLGHRNKYTGLRYADDPAIVALLITNENDITQHYGRAFDPGRGVPYHRALYAAQAEAFAEKHGLSKEKILRASERGPAKLFLNDLEQRFNAEMISHLRTLGAKVPIATTSAWGFSPLSSLPALSTGDFIDAHSYGASGELEADPRKHPNLIHWLAAARLADRPLTVSEWNVTRFPVPDRHVIPLYVAASARLQGWQALMLYAYSVDALNGPGVPSNWHAFNDPALIATLPAAALLYRKGHVREAETVYTFAASRELVFNRSVSPRNAVALRTAAEKGKLVIALPSARELPWLAETRLPAETRVITDPDESFLRADATETVSDTGELTRNWGEGTFVVATPRSQAAMGRIGGKRIALADVVIASRSRYATVAVQSLDDRPIAESTAIMICLGGASMPQSPAEAAFSSEFFEGELRIRAPAGLVLRLVAADGVQRRRVAVPYKNGQYRIVLDHGFDTHWLMLS